MYRYLCDLHDCITHYLTHCAIVYLLLLNNEYSCVIDKSYLLDVFTKLYIATDSNPVDGHTYELCSDLVDVVIDVSCIYGLSPTDGAAIPYDQDSCSAIRLNSGMVLYLREVSKYVALVCVLREEYFAKRSLLDYNINRFRSSLEQILRGGGTA